MIPPELWAESLGKHSVFVLWIILLIYVLYKSFRRKQWVWFGLLLLNCLIGLGFLSVILPLVYCVIYRKLTFKGE